MNFNLAEFESSYGRPDQLPPSDLPEIVFSGRSNVGKSSMLNALFGRKSLARVSATPGKTATINFFRLGELRFADLPGYGYAKVPKTEKERWQKLMRSYYEGDRNVALVFQLVDMRHPPTADDLAMIDFFIEGEFPFVVVLTKLDKLTKTQREARLEALRSELPCAEDITMIPISSQTGEGVEEVRDLIREIAGEADEDEDDEDNEDDAEELR